MSRGCRLLPIVTLLLLLIPSYSHAQDQGESFSAANTYVAIGCIRTVYIACTQHNLTPLQSNVLRASFILLVRLITHSV